MISIHETPLTLFTPIRNTIVKAIWDTEEKAIIFFKSVVYIQIAPIKAKPNKDTIIKVLKTLLAVITELSHKIPKPPNFNKIPAKIIEPYTGASTWARGSHKCKP